MTHFSVFIHFSIADLISFYKDKTWERRTDNPWSLLPLLCICWWYIFFLKAYHFYKKYDWYLPFFFRPLRIKTNLSKCEITDIGVLKGVHMAVCGMCCVDLKNHTLKIIGIHFSYNEKLKEEKTVYTTVKNIQRVLKIWKMRNLTLEGKILFLKQ